jgi:hypothetical protein
MQTPEFDPRGRSPTKGRRVSLIAKNKGSPVSVNPVLLLSRKVIALFIDSFEPPRSIDAPPTGADNAS